MADVLAIAMGDISRQILGLFLYERVLRKQTGIALCCELLHKHFLLLLLI